jgi:hypothetical protein
VVLTFAVAAVSSRSIGTASAVASAHFFGFAPMHFSPLDLAVFGCIVSLLTQSRRKIGKVQFQSHWVFISVLVLVLVLVHGLLALLRRSL